MAIAKLRAIQGWSLETYQAPIGLRSLNGYALTDNVVRKPNLALSLQDALIAAINREYAAGIKTEDFDFGPAQTLTNNQYNTMITLTARPSSGYSGDMSFRYNRIDLALVVYYDPANPVKIVEGASSTVGYLAALNTAFGLSLTAADIDDQPLLQDSEGNLMLLVKAQDASAFWMGQYNLQIQNYPNISTAFSGDTLSAY